MKKKFIKSIKNFFRNADPVLSILGLLSSIGVILVVLGIFLLINNFFIPIKEHTLLLFGLPLYYLISLGLYLDTVKHMPYLGFKSGYIFGMIITILAVIYRIITI
jgi:hypothetical protein